MTHLYGKTGHKFEVGQLIDSDGKSYDITVILKWDEPNEEELTSPSIIDYYFGDYDKDCTDSYIAEVIQKQEHLMTAIKLLEGELLVNQEVMEQQEINKFKDSIKALKEMIIPNLI